MIFSIATLCCSLLEWMEDYFTVHMIVHTHLAHNIPSSPQTPHVGPHAGCQTQTPMHFYNSHLDIFNIFAFFNSKVEGAARNIECFLHHKQGRFFPVLALRIDCALYLPEGTEYERVIVMLLSRSLLCCMFWVVS